MCGFLRRRLRKPGAVSGRAETGQDEHVLRQSEMARLEEQLAQIASAPRMAVTGPAPCEKQTPPPPRSGR
jgi:hypothetical protein